MLCYQNWEGSREWEGKWEEGIAETVDEFWEERGTDGLSWDRMTAGQGMQAAQQHNGITEREIHEQTNEHRQIERPQNKQNTALI